MMGEMGYYHCPRCGYGFRGRFVDNDEFVCRKCKSRFHAAVNEATGELAFIEQEVHAAPEPLYLPKGSIRSLVAFALAGCCWMMIFAGRDVPNSLLSVLLTVVAYYFGFRTDGRQQGRFHDPAHRRREPLHLPEGVVRVTLIAGFILSMLSLAPRGAINDAYMEFFMILFGLLVGYGFARMMDRMPPDAPRTAIGHAKGIVVLAAAGALVYLYLSGLHAQVATAHLALLCAVPTFYYGSRS